LGWSIWLGDGRAKAGRSFLWGGGRGEKIRNAREELKNGASYQVMPNLSSQGKRGQNLVICPYDEKKGRGERMYCIGKARKKKNKPLSRCA